MLRFVLVNDRTPRALCCTKIAASYVREINTRFYYCSRGCFVSHTRLGQLVLEHRSRAVR